MLILMNNVPLLKKKKRRKKDKLLINRENQQKTRGRKKLPAVNSPNNSNSISNNETENCNRTPVVVMGRPKLHDEDVLIKTISDTALAGKAADSRSRTVVINTCKTLDDLGYDLSSSSVYMRRLPK